MKKLLIFLGILLIFVGVGLYLLPEQEEDDIPFDFSYSMTQLNGNDDYLYGRYSNNFGEGTVFARRSRFAYNTEGKGILFMRNSMIRKHALAYEKARGYQEKKVSQLGFERNRRIAETKQRWESL